MFHLFNLSHISKWHFTHIQRVFFTFRLFNHQRPLSYLYPKSISSLHTSKSNKHGCSTSVHWVCIRFLFVEKIKYTVIPLPFGLMLEQTYNRIFIDFGCSCLCFHLTRKITPFFFCSLFVRAFVCFLFIDHIRFGWDVYGICEWENVAGGDFPMKMQTKWNINKFDGKVLNNSLLRNFFSGLNRK